MNFIAKWMNESYFHSIIAIFDENSSFLSILDTFWAIFGSFPIRPISMIPWLLNWIIFWIESAEFLLNWILFWIESWVKQYWIEYWTNHLLAKFKNWIESYRVSKTPRVVSWSLVRVVGVFQVGRVVQVIQIVQVIRWSKWFRLSRRSVWST